MFYICFSNEALSFWAYYYCSRVGDDPNVRKYITDPTDAYLYSKNVRNDVEELIILSKSLIREYPYV